ncbi:hypothetical protein V8C44DRAFT_320017 [Trichoderma aethiopicum]
MSRRFCLASLPTMIWLVMGMMCLWTWRSLMLIPITMSLMSLWTLSEVSSLSLAFCCLLTSLRHY